MIWVSEWFGEEAAANIWIIICILVGMLYLKMIATTMTFAAGGIGGTFAPTLFIGAVFGAMFALIVNAVVPSAALSVGNFSHVGITGVMAGVMHAPLTAIFLTMESTGGYTLIVPLMIVAAISFTISSLMSRRSIFSDDLKKTGDVVTHDKDKMILQYIELDKVIETNFIPLDVEMTLGQIVRNAVAKSTRNLFPVLSKSGRLLGVITLDEIRGIMFDHALYDKVTAESLMQVPLTFIDYRVDSMEEIMKKFQDSGMWNLPVVESEQMYYKGFVSKSKLLSVYRRMMINYNSEDM